jgi:hypothetical protein
MTAAAAPERKAQQTRRIAKIARFTSGSVLLACVRPALADNHKVSPLEWRRTAAHLSMDRVGLMSLSAAVSYPCWDATPGTASNHPTQPVNGIAPIGDWTVRGQNAFPFPPDIPEGGPTKLLFELSQRSESDAAGVHVAVRSASRSSGVQCDQRASKRNARYTTK